MQTLTRRQLLTRIGSAAGSAVMYQAMTALALADTSDYREPLNISGGNGTTVLVLGAGLAGLCAAYELRRAGYHVRVLEYNDRPGGRNWSLYGGDTYTELGGVTQSIRFDDGLYFNPGPWRIPHTHHAILHYCRLLNVPLEPFCQVNYDAYVHAANAFGGRPQRYRHVQADFDGYVAELLAKCTTQGKLDETVSHEDQAVLLDALREWGALDKNYAYAKSLTTSNRRGFAVDPGGGLAALPMASDLLPMNELLRSRLWNAIAAGHHYEFQSTLFQPRGGMGRIGQAFGNKLDGLIRYHAKVIDIRQDETGVTVRYEDRRHPTTIRHERADWVICTIPASVLSQIPMNVGAPMQNAIDALFYESAVKVGLQFKRRFWEEDASIYGGITYTDLPNSMISYPSDGFFTKKGVLLGAYAFGPHAYELTAMPPQDRIQWALTYGAQIHPQYPAEFEHGVSVAWHRVPWVLGCSAIWDRSLREAHYDDLCAFDGRIVLAGEHASRVPAWQEGALLSALDAVRRLHQRVHAA